MSSRSIIIDIYCFLKQLWFLSLLTMAVCKKLITNSGRAGEYYFPVDQRLEPNSCTIFFVLFRILQCISNSNFSFLHKNIEY